MKNDSHFFLFFFISLLLLMFVLKTSCYSLSSIHRSIHSLRKKVKVSSHPLKEFSKEIHPKTLPSETLYILDGSAMLMKSYFANDKSKTYSHHFSSEFSEVLYSLIPEERKAALIEHIQTTNNLNSPFFTPISSSISSSASSSNSPKISCTALIGMTMEFVKFIRDFQPKYLAITFDTDRETFRNNIFPAYKAHRPKLAADIYPQLLVAPKVMEALGCKCFSKKGYEADDLMASLGRWARTRDLNVVHVTNDKDLLQLIKPHEYVLNPKEPLRLIGKQEVQQKYAGVSPEQFVDYLSLVGDEADNVPGLPGIGAVSAAKLLVAFQSIDEMIRLFKLTELSPSKYTPNFTINSMESSKSLKELLKQHSNDILTEYMSIFPSKLAFDQHIASLLALTKGSFTEKRLLQVILSFYFMGITNLKLFQQLITLDDTLILNELESYSSSSFQSKFANYYEDYLQQNQPKEGEKEEVFSLSSSQLTLQSSTSDLTTSSSTMSFEVNSIDLTTSFFRYVGETSASKTKSTDNISFNNSFPNEIQLLQISSSFDKPLEYLRKQYYKLHRNLN